MIMSELRSSRIKRKNDLERLLSMIDEYDPKDLESLLVDAIEAHIADYLAIGVTPLGRLRDLRLLALRIKG